MGVVNITPDSFSDGGEYLETKTAIDHIFQLIEDGADIIDLGAESTRPKALPLTFAEEWKRLEPVLIALKSHNTHVQISVDTYKEETILRLLDYGVDYINNIKGLCRKDVLKNIAANNTRYIAMHIHGNPENMQNHPLGGEEAYQAVSNFFTEASLLLEECGFKKSNFWLDPGLCFGKNDEGNIRLIASIPEFSRKNQLAVGISRKSIFGRLLNIPIAKNRDHVSKIAELGLALAGAHIIRTHDVQNLAYMRKVLFS